MPAFASKLNQGQHQPHDATRPWSLLVARRRIGDPPLNYQHQHHPYRLRLLLLPNHPFHLLMMSHGNPYPHLMPSIQHVVNVLSPTPLIGGKPMSLPMPYFVIVAIGAIVRILYRKMNLPPHPTKVFVILLSHPPVCSNFSLICNRSFPLIIHMHPRAPSLSILNQVQGSL